MFTRISSIATEPTMLSALRMAMSIRLHALRSIRRLRFWCASIFSGLRLAEWKDTSIIGRQNCALYCHLTINAISWPLKEKYQGFIALIHAAYYPLLESPGRTCLRSNIRFERMTPRIRITLAVASVFPADTTNSLSIFTQEEICES